MRDRVLEFSEAEFAAAARRKVEALFEANRASPDASRKIPVIDELYWVEYTYDPRAPAEEHAELIDLAVRALLAQKWFEGEAPRWLQPLPLNEAERVALNSSGDRRLAVVARYAVNELQSRDWNYERATPFIDFYAQVMRPG